MKRRIGIFVAILIISAPSGSWSWSGASGYHPVIALFNANVHPDLPFDRFAAGRLGVIHPGWRWSFLYGAYRYLAGSGFDADEQKALVSYWNSALGIGLTDQQMEWMSEGALTSNATAIRVGAALSAWLSARNKVPGIPAIDRIYAFKSDPKSMFSYANCNADAFQTAADTLGAMIGKYGLASPQVKKWVGAQDLVFDNCSDTPPRFVDNSNDWFAAADTWDNARKRVAGAAQPPSFDSNCPAEKFRASAIELNKMTNDSGGSDPKVKQWMDARDQMLAECSRHPPGPPMGPFIPAQIEHASPFEREQRDYQIASATFYGGDYDAAIKMFQAIAADRLSPWRNIAPYLVARATIRKATLSSGKNDMALLAQAETQLNQIVATSSDAGVKRAARHLLGFVEAQLHPQQRLEELARAVMTPEAGSELRRDVSDYIWMLNNKTPNPGDYHADITDWILTMSGEGPDSIEPVDARAHAIAKWKQTSSVPWLVAALIAASVSDPSAPALIHAAAAVKPQSPAYVTVTYYEARLLIGEGKTGEARARLDSILARSAELPISAVNELKGLRMSVARNLDEMLTFSLRTPLGLTDDGDFDQLPSPLTSPALEESAAGPLFDDDGASALNRCLPLNLLLRAAQSDSFPPSLRERVARATVIRAILLGDEPAARELAPLVAQSDPELKPGIESWLKAKNADEREFDAAFLMLQNPGLRFTVGSGPGRMTDFDQIDSYRDNWWPAGEFVVAKTTACPSFLSTTQKTSADDEWKKLAAINAPNYLCRAALEQAGRRPHDARVPEALHLCVRAVHFGCSNKDGSALAKSAFVSLHQRYPDNPWTYSTEFWYKGGGCGGA